MKKLLGLTAMLATSLAFADSLTVGTVGVLAVNCSTKSSIIAASFGNLEDASGSTINVSNIVKTANLTAGDRLYVYANGTYVGWTLAAGTGDAKYWAKDENTYTIGANGQPVAGTGSDASTTTKTYGEGVFLVRGEGYTEGTAFMVYLYGRPVSGTTTLTGGTTALVGNPTSTDKAPTITGMAKGDKIVTVGVNGVQLPTTYNGTAWSHIDKSTHLPGEGLPTIPAGTGFWYVTEAGSNPTISW